MSVLLGFLSRIRFTAKYFVSCISSRNSDFPHCLFKVVAKHFEVDLQRSRFDKVVLILFLVQNVHQPYIPGKLSQWAPVAPRRMLPFCRGIQGYLLKLFSFCDKIIALIALFSGQFLSNAIFRLCHSHWLRLRRRRTSARSHAGPGLVLPRHRRLPLKSASLPEVL